MKTKGKGLTIKSMQIMYALIPLVTSIIVLSIASYFIVVSNLEANTKEELRLAAKTLREYYEYDLINDNDLVDGFCEYDTDYIDSVASVGVDFTLFKENIRFMTTIKDASGQRIEGTECSPAVWEAVGKNMQDYYSDDVVINGTDYYVYYMPLTDGTTVYGMAFAGKTCHEVNMAKQHVFIMVIISGVILIVFFFILASIVAKKVSDPLKAAAAGITEISKGNTDVKINASTNIRETREILNAANLLSETLNTTISGVKEKVSELADNANTLNNSTGTAKGTIDNLDTGANEIAAGAGSQAQEVTESAAAVSDVVNNMEEIGRNIEETNARTEEMYKQSEMVSSQFETLIEDTKRSSEELTSISEKMERVAGAVEAVVNAAQQINDIASQTNLLSLNASIEAARAGEAGKGFAVVADEISKLATESNDSAEEIRTIMNTLRAETDNAVTMINKMNDTMNKQVETSENSQKALNDLSNAIKETKENVSAVKEGTVKVQDLCNSLNDSISNLSAISEENAASAQHTSAGITQMNQTMGEIGDMADGLNDIAIKLEELTDYFTV